MPLPILRTTGASVYWSATAFDLLGSHATKVCSTIRARSFLGYRLISELFAFPEKFLFVDLVGLSQEELQQIGAGNRVDIFVFLEQSSHEIERYVDADTFQLGCTPLVNLFRKRAEPIRLLSKRYEHRVVPDARRSKSHEVFTIDRVVATSPTDETVEFFPLYSLQHGDGSGTRRAYWHSVRRPSTSTQGEVDHGTEVFLSLSDFDASPAEFDNWIVDVQTTCLNRDLPGRIPFGGGQPRLQITTGGAAVRVECLTPPTKTRRPELGDALLWRLVSMLSLNHLSLVDGQEQGAALREVLALHDLVATENTRTMIDGLARVDSRRVVGRAGGAAAGGFCRGVEVTLSLDEDRFSGGGLYLFASVIDRFLGMYATINSFTRTRVLTKQDEAPLCQWPPRAAEQVLA